MYRIAEIRERQNITQEELENELESHHHYFLLMKLVAIFWVVKQPLDLQKH